MLHLREVVSGCLVLLLPSRYATSRGNEIPWNAFLSLTLSAGYLLPPPLPPPRWVSYPRWNPAESWAVPYYDIARNRFSVPSMPRLFCSWVISVFFTEVPAVDDCTSGVGYVCEQFSELKFVHILSTFGVPRLLMRVNFECGICWKRIRICYRIRGTSQLGCSSCQRGSLPAWSVS
jgi:hypothetical protein